MSVFTPEVQPRARVLCSSLARIVREYYRDPQHRAEFEKWHLQKYGEPYQWVPMKGGNDNKTI